MRRRLAFFLRQARKLSLYFLVPALSAIAPLIVIPAVTSRYGADGWAVIAVATSLGGSAAILAELGWNVVGPQQISRDPAGSGRLYKLSLASKLTAVVLLAPAAGIAAALLVTSYPLGAALVAVGAVFSVLSPTWYFIGKSRPLMVLTTDTLPKVLISVIAAVAIAAGAPLELYGVALIVSAFTAYVGAVVLGRLPAWPGRSAFRESPKIIRRQAVIIAGRGISTFYTSLPTALLGATNPGAVATFSAVDRPMRMGIILDDITNRFPHWI